MKQHIANAAAALEDVGCLLVAVIVAVLAIIGAYELGKHSAAVPPTRTEVISSLSHDERQKIAIQFLCGPGGWKGVEMFCGPMDSDREEQK